MFTCLLARSLCSLPRLWDCEWLLDGYLFCVFSILAHSGICEVWLSRLLACGDVKPSYISRTRMCTVLWIRGPNNGGTEFRQKIDYPLQSRSPMTPDSLEEPLLLSFVLWFFLFLIFSWFLSFSLHFFLSLATKELFSDRKLMNSSFEDFFSRLNLFTVDHRMICIRKVKFKSKPMLLIFEVKKVLNRILSLDWPRSWYSILNHVRGI